MLLLEMPSVEKRLATVALYVRSHVADRLTLETLASEAGLSPFHFHRIFRAAFGENLNAYIIRHRLQRAARMLRDSSHSITDIALDCGYESPSAFGAAFARAYGSTPSLFRAAPVARQPAAYVAQPFVDTLSEPRITSKDACDALGVRYVGPYDCVSTAMERMLDIARRRTFLPAAEIFGLSYDSPDIEDHDRLRFDACVSIVPGADVAGARADGLSPIVIPGGTFAVFRHRGSYDRISHIYDLIVTAYILTERFRLRDAPFINTYLRDPASCAVADLECDLAIPIF